MAELAHFWQQLFLLDLMFTTGISNAVLSFAFLAPGGSNRLIDSLFDDTFAGIHRLEWFDYALMGPYSNT